MQCSERLHAHLINLLVSDWNVPDAKFTDIQNKQAIFEFLTTCNNILKKMKAKHFYMYVAFGYLEVFRNTTV